MSKDTKYRLNDFLKESTRFNINDVLIHINREQKKLFFSDLLSFGLNEFPQSILRETKKLRKEAGVNILSRTTGILEHLYEGKKVHTPIILHSLQFEIDRIKSRITFKIIDEDWFVNPFLQNYISSILEKEIPNFKEIEDVFSFLNEIGFTKLNKEDHFIGNFHHHRFQIIKELEDLINCTDLNSNVKVLLGSSDVKNKQGIHFRDIRLLPSDVDHEKVFVKLSQGNCVVQGPPGTGKSQVLTNVLANNLWNEATTIVVSEKRVALEVLVKKLGDFNLDKLCFVATSDKLSHSFLQDLKSSWDYFDRLDSYQSVNLGLSKQYEDRLQMILNLLQQEELVGGVSFSKFNTVSLRFIGWEDALFSSETPSISNALMNETFIRKIYNKSLPNIIGYISPSFYESDVFLTSDSKVKSMLSLLLKISNIIPFSTFDELRQMMKLAADCQVFENENYKKHAPIFQLNSRPQKRFLSLRKKYLKKKNEVEILQNNQSHWKIIPSEIETKSLLQDFKKRGFFKKMKSQKRWREISTLPRDKAVELLTNHLKQMKVFNDYSKILIDFCEIGIENPEIEVDSIFQTLMQFSSDKWLKLYTIPLIKRQNLTSLHLELNSLFSGLRSLFHLDETIDLKLFLESFILNFENLLSLRKEMVSPENNLFKLLRYQDCFNSFFQVTLKSNWVKFKDQFPEFSDFKMSFLKDKVEEVLHQEHKESYLLAKEIELGIKKRFDNYHLLLQTPARKLTKKEKELKVNLRKGKSILIKEFIKSRSHPSLRELFNSEARIWIQLLKPIWLSNPTQLSKCFPLEKDLFDLSIFDEASQIPLQNALGAIQRSKQTLIAGDEHQMGPSSYFQKGEVEVVDLLHQANYHFPKVSLHHHYRSAHPDLIAFSNKHFYKNELMVFPSYPTTTPLHHYYVEKGIFSERKNRFEAQKIVQGIKNQLKIHESIGIVAFSEEQLNCIWNELDVDTQQILNERIESNKAFFKSLENVQGDECDHLFISFGYGKNEFGEFSLRFGPMNTANGRNRLNVLLTRAKKSIHFYCSVQSSDFKLTENENVQLIKKWILFSENYKPNKSLYFPFQLKPIIRKNELEFVCIHEKISTAKELVTLHRVLNNRGWTTIYN